MCFRGRCDGGSLFQRTLCRSAVSFPAILGGPFSLYTVTSHAAGPPKDEEAALSAVSLDEDLDIVRPLIPPPPRRGDCQLHVAHLCTHLTFSRRLQDHHALERLQKELEKEDLRPKKQQFRVGFSDTLPRCTR